MITELAIVREVDGFSRWLFIILNDAGYELNHDKFVQYIIVVQFDKLF